LWQARHRMTGFTEEQVSDLVFYGAIGVILGGRLGYVLFYDLGPVLAAPWTLFFIWQGGMSFHGGLIGGAATLAWFARRNHMTFFQVSDFVAPLVPMGLGFGRLGNFANTELPGRVTDTVFGFIYPCSADAIRAINQLCVGQWESFARHPSPLYQAFGEGVVLFTFVWLLAAKPRPTGTLSGGFLAGYGCVRLVTEYFRQPDGHLGFIAFDALTMGQLLSLPMVIVGILIMLWANRLTRLPTQ
ncbi:MAG: prolipoprotein diacylglyceryl transferase, partial [Proteobacteria bacterium]|nr:prolipoprotein diacylglyceryl transferase [Pseudomonadota bacterium]